MKPENTLTTRQFWLDYWRNVRSQPVPRQVFFSSLLDRFPPAPARFLEIGGFPGTYSAYFRKYLGYEVSLLDFVIAPEVVAEVERVNGLAPETIRCIEGNLLERSPSPDFDVVFSAGFLEHFRETETLFSRHCDYLAPGGTLFISMPNFRGVSGWVQMCLDPANYAAHNLECMEPALLRSLAEKAGLENVRVEYHGVPHLWLEQTARGGRPVRRLVALLSALLQRSGEWLHGRWFSPYLVITATKGPAPGSAPR